MKYSAMALVAMLAFASEGFADSDDVSPEKNAQSRQQDETRDDAVIICNPDNGSWNGCPRIFKELLEQSPEHGTARSSSPFGLWMFMPWHPTPAERVLDGYTTSTGRMEAGA